jgi:CRP-like cAMP-binding protein
MSDILGRNRSCNVKAETDCRVVYLSQGIDEIIRTRPHLTWRLMRDLAQRLEHITENIHARELIHCGALKSPSVITMSLNNSISVISGILNVMADNLTSCVKI